MMSTEFWDIWTPSPSLSAKSIPFVCKFAAFLDTPFYADVSYWIPLTGLTYQYKYEWLHFHVVHLQMLTMLKIEVDANTVTYWMRHPGRQFIPHLARLIHLFVLSVSPWTLVPRGRPYMTSSKFSVFWTPSLPCRHLGLIYSTKFTQPPLLHLLLA